MNVFFQYVTDSDIIPGYRTEHSAIILKLKFQNNEREGGIGNLITVY